MRQKKQTIDSVRRRYYRLALVFLVAALQGCASFKPLPSSESLFLERVQRQTINNVEVAVAVPGSAETRQIFGVDLYQYSIQPVWIEI
jgi:hypothetical protein